MKHIRNLVDRLTLVGLGDSALLRRQEGQTLVEYSLILALIAVVVIGVVTLLGTQVSSVFNTVYNDL
jgi:pilus assembly protein Flp/PilA